MFKKISLRKKLLILRLSVVITFIILIFPISNRLLGWVVHRSMKITAKKVISKLKDQPNSQELARYLSDGKYNNLFYATLFDENLEPLYDARAYDQQIVSPAEKEELSRALQQGKTFHHGGPDQAWSYAAQRFYFQDKPYLMMVSLTVDQVGIWIGQFQAILFILVASFLVVAGVIVWWGTSRLTQPLLDIVRLIRPYALGKTDIIPLIPIHRVMGPECRYLATGLNTLSERLKEQTRLVGEEKNEKEVITESLLEGVIAIDAAGFVRYANHTASNMLNVPRRQIIGKPFAFPHNHPKADLFAKCKNIIRLAEEQGNVITDSISIGENQKVYLDLIAVPKPLKKGAILILQDNSNHHKVVKMGKDFIANASHELRTPITIIKGFAETLQDLPLISPPMLAEITEKIVRNCHRMDTLVKNLLTLADMEYVPESRFQPCDIVALSDNCRHLLLTLSPRARVDIEKTHDRIMADADPDLLELALINLLENGAKYSKPPAHLTIYLKSQGGEVIIAIQDRGIGIPKDDLPHIFERFYTVDKAHSRRLGGAGLGLSIVQTIIEKHEGTISAASVVGQGTTFTIVLPQHRHAMQPTSV